MKKKSFVTLNVSEDKEDKNDNMSDGEIWEIPLPPDEVDDEGESYVSSEGSHVSACQEENQPVHIKIRMKQRTQKGKGLNFFESLVTIFKILTDFEQNVELLPFSDDDIGQGIKKIEDLRRKKKLWERFAKGCKHVQKTSFVTLHIKVDMKSTLLELKRKADFFAR